jgi:hypothetical protein
MKKLLLLLLLPYFAISQTSNGREFEVEAIKTTGSQTITTPVYLVTEGVDGTHGKTTATGFEKTANKQNSLTVDGTGVKYPTVDAVNTALGLKANLGGGNSFSGNQLIPNSTLNVGVLEPLNSIVSISKNGIIGYNTQSTTNKSFELIQGGSSQGEFSLGTNTKKMFAREGVVAGYTTAFVFNDGVTATAHVTTGGTTAQFVDGTGALQNKSIFQNAITGLTTNYLPKWNGSGFGNSNIFDNGTNVGVGTNNPLELVHLQSSQPVIRYTKPGILNWFAGNVSGNDYVVYSDSGGANMQLMPTGGNILIGTTTDNGSGAKLQVNGGLLSTQYKISALNTAPASATATGTLGEIRVTATHIYVCTATNTWVRTALATW